MADIEKLYQGSNLETLLSGESSRLSKLLENQQSTISQLDTKIRQLETDINRPWASAGGLQPFKSESPVPYKEPFEPIWDYIKRVNEFNSQELNKLRQQQADEITRLGNYVWRQQAVQIATSKDYRYEDFIRSLPNNPSATEEDMQYINSMYATIMAEKSKFAQSVLTSSVPARTPTETIAGTQRDEAQLALAKKTQVIPVGLDQLTTDEIVRAIRGQATPNMPSGVTDPLDLFEYDDLDEFIDENEQAIIDAWAGFQATKDEMLKTLREGENPPLSFWEIVKEVALQPALAAMDLAMVVSEYYSRPLAGSVILGFSQIPEAITGKPTPFRAYWKKARDKGENMWMAAGEIFEAEDIPNWNMATKLIAEMALDPISYLGWGAASKAALKVPLVGKYLAAANDAFIRLTDLPFKGLSAWLKKVVPKTPTQSAKAAGMDAVQTMRAAVAQVTRSANPETWSAKAVTDLAKQARDFVIAHPDLANTSDLARFGKYQLMSTHIGVDEIVDLASKLKVDKPSVQQLSELSDIYNISRLPEATRGQLTIKESAAQFARILGADTNDSNLTAIAKFITDRQTSDLRAVNKIFTGSDPNEMFKNFGTHINNTSLAQLTSPVYKFNIKNNLLASFATKVDGFLHWAPAVAVDKQFSVPISRMYLKFTAYSPFNVAETYMKSGFRGIWLTFGDIFSDTNPVKLAQYVFSDLSNAPIDAMNYVVRSEQAIISSTVGKSQLAAGKMPILERVLAARPGGKLAEKVLPGKFKWMGNIDEFAADLQTRWRDGWYVLRQWSKELETLAPEEVSKVRAAVGRLQDTGFTSYTKREVKEMQEYINYVAYKGKSAILGLKKTPSELYKNRVNYALDEMFGHHPDIDQVYKNTIRDEVINKNGLDDINNLMQRVVDRFKDDELYKSVYYARVADELAKEFSNVPIESIDDWKAWSNWISDSISSHDMDMFDLRSTVTRRAADLGKDVAGKDALHAAAWKNLSAYMDSISNSTTTMATKMRADLAAMKNIDPVVKSGLDKLVDTWESHTKLTIATRTEAQNAFNRKMSQLAGGKRDDVFWTEMNSEWDVIWDNFRKHMTGVYRTQFDVEAALGKTPKPLKPVKDIKVTNISYIFNATGENLASSLLRGENNHFMSKDYFTSYVRAKAESVASKFKTNADDLGFTLDGIGRCYDDMIRSMGLNPDTMSELTPMLTKFEDMRMGMDNIAKQVKINPEDAMKYNKYIDDLAEEVGNIATPGVTKDVPIDISRLSFSNMDDAFKNSIIKEIQDVGIEVPDNVKGFVRNTSLGGDALFNNDTHLIELGSNVKSSAPMVAHELAHAHIDNFLKSGSTTIDLYMEFQDIAMKYGLKPAHSVKDWNSVLADIGKALDEGDSIADVMGHYMLNEGLTESLSRFMRSDFKSSSRALYTDLMNYEAASSEISELFSKFGFKKTIKGMTEGGIPHSIREKAMEAARTKLSIDFADYTNENALNAVMKMIFPFWTYEAHRWPWVFRNLAQKPGVFLGWGKYMDATDGGYLPIPGTDIEFNIFRGTIFSGGFRRLWQKDFPEYYDRFPMFTEAMDYIGRAGFYPGPIVSIPMMLFGATTNKRPEFGEVLPPRLETGIDAFMSIFPDDKTITAISNIFLPDRYRDYQIMLELNKMGYDGDVLLAKKEDGIEFTDEENSAWANALRKISAFSAINQQMGLFRFRPQEMKDAFNLSSKFIEEQSGIPVSVQEWIRRHSAVTGKNMSYYYALDPLQQKALYEIEQVKQWSKMAYPLKPSWLKDKETKVILYYHQLEELSDKSKTEGISDFISRDEADRRLMNFFAGSTSDTMTPVQWVTEQQNISEYIANYGDVLKNDPHYKDVPITLEERIQSYKDNYNMEPVFHPAQELLYKYYEIRPEKKDDIDLGWTYDWDTYFRQIEAIHNALPDDKKQEFISMIQRNWTPMYKMFWNVNREYFRPYRNVRTELLSKFDAEEQSILKRSQVAGAAELNEIKTQYGELVSNFETAVRNTHRNMRLLNPTLDAWLNVWAKNQTLLTPEAERIYKAISQDIASGNIDNTAQFMRKSKPESK